MDAPSLLHAVCNVLKEMFPEMVVINVEIGTTVLAHSTMVLQANHAGVTGKVNEAMIAAGLETTYHLFINLDKSLFPDDRVVVRGDYRDSYTHPSPDCSDSVNCLILLEEPNTIRLEASVFRMQWSWP